mmetsp:Transcript_19011/g.34377  ORF Transcript_19011/g.34377 Transcript_19011/m.34377 type:complete len:260 (-) Transcript_19011:258-1037(-)
MTFHSHPSHTAADDVARIAAMSIEIRNRSDPPTTIPDPETCLPEHHLCGRSISVYCCSRRIRQCRRIRSNSFCHHHRSCCLFCPYCYCCLPCCYCWYWFLAIIRHYCWKWWFLSSHLVNQDHHHLHLQARCYRHSSHLKNHQCLRIRYNHIRRSHLKNHCHRLLRHCAHHCQRNLSTVEKPLVDHSCHPMLYSIALAHWAESPPTLFVIQPRGSHSPRVCPAQYLPLPMAAAGGTCRPPPPSSNCSLERPSPPRPASPD